MLSGRVTDEQSKTLETLAERINGCLTERLDVIPEKGAELLAALGAYHQAVAALTDDEVAYLEMLLRTSTGVAQFLREHRNEIIQSKEASAVKSEE
jgi:Ser/Thr protein kinase RdoA (MazF antagonist)